MTRIKGSSVRMGDSFLIDGNSSKINYEYNDTETIEARTAAAEIIHKANEEYAVIIKNAEEQVEKLLKDAREEIEKIKEVAHKTGFDKGYSEGQSKILDDLHNKIKSVEILAASALEIKKEVILSSERDILDLTIAIAERIIREKLNISPEIILNIIKSALNQVKDKEEVKILVNPAVTKYLYEHSEELKNSIKGLKNIKIIEDRTIRPDGALIESMDSKIDARLETQIEEITKQLLQQSEETILSEEKIEEITVEINNTKAKKKKNS